MSLPTEVRSALAELPTPAEPWDMDSVEAQRILNEFCGEYLGVPYQIFRRKWNTAPDTDGGFTTEDREELMPLASLLRFAAAH